jgi:hypothetical protein
MRTSYFGTALTIANFQATSGRPVDHSMDAACEFQLCGKDFCDVAKYFDRGSDVANRVFRLCDEQS